MRLEDSGTSPGWESRPRPGDRALRSTSMGWLIVAGVGAFVAAVVLLIGLVMASTGEPPEPPDHQ